MKETTTIYCGGKTYTVDSTGLDFDLCRNMSWPPADTHESPFSLSFNSGTCRLCRRIVCPSCLDGTQVCIACRKENAVESWNMALLRHVSRPPTPQADPDLIDHLRHSDPIPVDPRLISIEQHGLDISWFEDFWNACVTGVTLLWNVFACGLVGICKAIPGMHTPADSHYVHNAPVTIVRRSTDESVQLSEDGQHFFDALTTMANAGKITLFSPTQQIEVYEPIPDVDYEQPMVMYPDVPAMEREYGI